MKIRNRWLAILVAVAGAGLSTVALVGFLLTMVRNNLPWAPGQSIRDYYIAVGESYSQGFTVGFFLCFFLHHAVAVRRWPRRSGHRRGAARAVAPRAVLRPARVRDGRLLRRRPLTRAAARGPRC